MLGIKATYFAGGGTASWRACGLRALCGPGWRGTTQPPCSRTDTPAAT